MRELCSSRRNSVSSLSVWIPLVGPGLLVALTWRIFEGIYQNKGHREASAAKKNCPVPLLKVGALTMKHGPRCS
uniref:Uncharacterized protein n=1 Tax=Anguilla anguilla TaxID=7936 RepID=A0A0E9W8S3_ANGAN